MQARAFLVGCKQSFPQFLHPSDQLRPAELPSQSSEANAPGNVGREGKAAEHDQQQQQQQQHSSVHLPPLEDTWEQHVERVLTDSQASLSLDIPLCGAVCARV